MALIKKEDPKWIKKISEDISKNQINIDDKLVKKLFLDYITEGLPPMEAYNKAKKIASLFKN